MKKTFIITTLLVVISFSSFALVQAKSDKNIDSDLPEVNGTYDVPGRPALKVRVFVHNPRVKPGPPASPLPSLVCDLPDPDSAAVVGLAGWHLPATPWVYRLNTSSVPSSVGSGDLVKIVNNSFGAWTEAITSGGRVAPVIRNGGNTTINRARFDGQNVITWGRTSSTALGVTYIWYYTTTYEVAEVDTVMNQKFSWDWSDPSTWPPDPEDDTCAYTNVYDAQNIMVHEIGHWYGLDDEYDTASYAHNTMYGYGSKKETKKDTLTTGDITGINNIYR